MNPWYIVPLLAGTLLLGACEDDPILEPTVGETPSGSYGKINLLDPARDTIPPASNGAHASNPKLF